MPHLSQCIEGSDVEMNYVINFRPLVIVGMAQGNTLKSSLPSLGHDV